jgi:hypothetical protein
LSKQAELENQSDAPAGEPQPQTEEATPSETPATPEAPKTEDDSVDQTISEISARLSRYENTIIRSAAFRAIAMDEMQMEEEKPEGKPDEKPEGKPGLPKPFPPKKPGDDEEVCGKEKVEKLISELEKIIQKIKAAIGKGLDLEEEVKEKGEKPVLPGKEKEIPMKLEKIESAIEYATKLQKKAENEIEKLQQLFCEEVSTEEDKRPEGAGVKQDEAQTQPSTPADKTVSTEEGKPASEEGKEEEKPSTEEGKPAVEEVVPEEAAITTDEVVDFLNRENFFSTKFTVAEEDVGTPALDEAVTQAVEETISETAAPDLELIRKKLSGQEISETEAEVLEGFSDLVAEKLRVLTAVAKNKAKEASMKKADTADVFLYNAPTKDKVKPVQEDTAKQNQKFIDKSMKETYPEKMDRRFLSLKAEVEKIMNSKFAKFVKAMDTAGMAQYKEIIDNPLKTALYKKCQAVGLNAYVAYNIIEPAFDEAAQTGHETVIEHAKKLTNLEDDDFIKKMTEISKDNKKVNALLDNPQPQKEAAAEEVSVEKTASYKNNAVVGSSPAVDNANESTVHGYWNTYFDRRSKTI